MQPLETERLFLRPFRMSDLNDFYEYAQNPNVGPNAGWQPHTSREESAVILQKLIEGGGIWAIEYKSNNKVIGSVGLHEDRFRKDVNARMIGYVLAEAYWGAGLMTEAVRRVIRHVFDESDTDVLSVYHYPHNARSRRVIEKCGFNYEGTLRKSTKIFSGEVMDSVCYSITKEDYEQEWAQ